MSERILAIIPARGGSKGVPRKNIRDLCGKPVIAWTIETALAAGDDLHRVIVSTDDGEIADAARVAGDADSWAIGSVVASDAFFPFADGLLAAAEAGATAVIQPGGSVRDEEVIAAADEKGLAMVFTGMRHFRH